jgi:murein endopeptidase
MSTMSKSNRNNAQPEWTNATRRVPNGEDANNDNQQSHPTSPIGDIEKGEMSEFNVGGASRKGTTDTDLTMTTVTERDEKRRHDGQLPSPSTSSTIYVTDGVEDVNPNGVRSFLF